MRFHPSNSILITGASSFVGRHMVYDLLQNQQPGRIIASSRNHEPLKKFLGKNADHQKITYADFDLLSMEKVADLFKTYTPDYCVHLAALARLKDGEENPVLAVQANIMATIKLIQLSISHGSKACLFASSNLAREALSVTGITKFLIEAYIHKLNHEKKLSSTQWFSYRLPNIIDSPGSVGLVFKRLINENKAITITHPEMSRKFETGSANASQMLEMLQTGRSKDIFINNMASTKIMLLAQNMIRNSGKKLDIEIIGKKPGEKLHEKDYPINEILKTGIQDIYILKEKKPDQEKLKRVFDVLIHRCHHDQRIIEFLKSFQHQLMATNF